MHISNIFAFPLLTSTILRCSRAGRMTYLCCILHFVGAAAVLQWAKWVYLAKCRKWRRTYTNRKWCHLGTGVGIQHNTRSKRVSCFLPAHSGAPSPTSHPLRPSYWPSSASMEHQSSVTAEAGYSLCR